MKYKKHLMTALLVSIAVTAGVAARAQSPEAARPARALDALPSSDVIIYADVRRILEEALPRMTGQQQQPPQLQRALADLQRTTGLDLHSINTLVIAGSYDTLDPNGSTGLVLFDGSFDTHALLASLTSHTGGAAVRTRLGMRDALAIDGRQLAAPRLLAATRQRNAPPRLLLVEFAPGLLALGDRASLERSLRAYTTGQGRFLGLGALPSTSATAAPLISVLMTVPPQTSTADVPPQLRNLIGEETLQVMSSLREIQFAVGFDGTNFPVMLSFKTDSAESATKLNKAIQSLGTLLDSTQADGEQTASARQAAEFLRTVELGQSGEYVMMAARVKASTLGSLFSQTRSRAIDAGHQGIDGSPQRTRKSQR